MGYRDWSYIKGVSEDRLRSRFSSVMREHGLLSSDELVLASAEAYVYFGHHTFVPRAEITMNKIVEDEAGEILTMRWQDGDSWQLTARSGAHEVNHVSRPDCFGKRYSKTSAVETIEYLVARWDANETKIERFFRRYWRCSEGGRSDEIYELAEALSLKRPWEIELSGNPAAPANTAAHRTGYRPSDGL